MAAGMEGEPGAPNLGQSAEERTWAALREALHRAADADWTPERADRVFHRIMETLERRRRRRQWAMAIGAVTVPAALLVAARALR